MPYRATGYELQAQGREPRMYQDAQQAGAAFFAARREERPKVLIHEVFTGKYKGEPFEDRVQPRTIAFTVPDVHDPSGYGHIFLDPDASYDFRLGYAHAQEAMPDKAVPLQDVADEALRGPVPTFQAMKQPQSATLQPEATQVENTIEPAPERVQRQEQPASHAAPAPQAPQPEVAPARHPAAAPAQVAQHPHLQPVKEARQRELLTSLQERFDVRGNDYCFMRDGQVAFTDHGNRLATKSDAPFVARSMVDLAEAKGWDALTLNGSEDFRRVAWLEAASRGLEVRGYTPTVQDRQQLAERQPPQQAPQHNSIEPTPGLQQGGTQHQSAPGQDQAANPAHPAQAAQSEGSTKQQHLEVMQAILKQQGVEPFQARAVLARMAEVMDAKLARGEPLPQLKVFDARAQTQAPMHVPQPTQQPVRTQTVSR